MVSVGADRAMAVFDTLTGRCLGRKVLGFDATVVYSPQMDPNNVHRAGQTTFVVGGKEGQIRIFSVELINPLIAKFSEIWKVREGAKLVRSNTFYSCSHPSDTFSSLILRLPRVQDRTCRSRPILLSRVYRFAL